MSESRPMWRLSLSARDRRMLTAAYLPLIVFAAVLIAARIARTQAVRL